MTGEFPYDYHVHSCYSFDSQSKPGDIIRKAREKSLMEIAVTDHCFRLEDLEGLVIRSAHLDRLKKEYTGLLVGTELSIEVPFIMEALKRGIFAPLDIVIAGFHGFQTFKLYPEFDENGMCNRNFSGLCREIGMTHLMDDYFKTLITAVETGNVDVIAHPFDLFYFADFLNEDLLGRSGPWLDTCAEHQVMIELNAPFLAGWKIKGMDNREKQKLIDFYVEFIDKCKQFHLLFSIGSDAHYLDGIGDFRGLQPFLADIGPEFVGRNPKK